MGETVDNVCTAIDDNLVRNLELMQEKVIINVQIEKLLREGHIELAKAKYIRGKESISILQVPADEEGVVPLLDLETKFEDKNDKGVPSFDIILKKVDSDGNEIKDPIKWFGVLVPQSLRTSQKHFQESLYLAARAANIQAEMTSVLEKLQSLYLLKNISCKTDSNKE